MSPQHQQYPSENSIGPVSGTGSRQRAWRRAFRHPDGLKDTTRPNEPRPQRRRCSARRDLRSKPELSEIKSGWPAIETGGPMKPDSCYGLIVTLSGLEVDASRFGSPE